MFVKVLITAAIAFGGIRCLPVESLNANGNFNPNVFVENGAALTSKLMKSLNGALEEIKPNFENIVKELSPEMQGVIEELVKEGRAKIDGMEKGFEYVFSKLAGALKDTEKAKPCTEKSSPKIQRWIHSFENLVLEVFEKIKNLHEEELNNIREGGIKIYGRAKDIFNRGITEMVNCLTPGKKDSKTCLNAETDRIFAGILRLGTELFILKQTVDDSFGLIVEDFVKIGLPKFSESIKVLKEINGELGKCVSELQ